MKKNLFRPLGTLFCSALLAGALSAPAMAANEIAVRVDDPAGEVHRCQPDDSERPHLRTVSRDL